MFVAGALLLAPLAPAVAAASPFSTSPQGWGSASGGSANVIRSRAVSNGSVSCDDGEFFGGTIVGNVVVPGNSFCLIDEATVTGSVVVSPGAEFIATGDTIDGSLASSGAFAIAIGNAEEEGGSDMATTILGSVTITGTTGTPGFPETNVICDATSIGKSLVVSSNQAPFSIGTDPDCFFPGTSPAGDTIGGSVTVTQNRGLDTVFDDGIGSVLACTSNKPSPIGGSDTVGGVESGQCTGF